MWNKPPQRTQGFSGGSGKTQEKKPCGFCNGVRSMLGIRPSTGKKVTPQGRYPNA